MTGDDVRFARRALRYFSLPAVALSDEYSGDCAVQLRPGAVPLVLLGPRWHAASQGERRKRLVHELLHVRGLGHDRSARRLGYYSSPRRDRLSRRVYAHLARGGRRFDPRRFGLSTGAASGAPTAPATR